MSRSFSSTLFGLFCTLVVLIFCHDALAESAPSGAWDMSFQIDAETGVETCGFGQTILAEPNLGGPGGRVILAFAQKQNFLSFALTITGGLDTVLGVEIIVDGHRVAAGRPAGGVLRFPAKMEQSLIRLFRAGNEATILFYRNRKPRELLFSLMGFSGAVKTVRRRCTAS